MLDRTIYALMIYATYNAGSWPHEGQR